MDNTAYQAIVMGASAGGLEALSSFLKQLPADFILPIIIVCHRLAVPDSELSMILNRYSPLPVQDAEQFDSINPGNVYLAPPCYHLLIADDLTFNLSADPLVNSSRPSIDVTFETAAEVFGEHLIGIILTGNSNDGALGMLKIKQEKGYTIAQDPQTAQGSVMPSAAIATTKIDFIGSIDAIAQHVCYLAGLEVTHHEHIKD